MITLKGSLQMQLNDKVAIVTGSGQGLGRSYALALAAAGASVVVNDVDEAQAKQVAEEIADAGGTAVAEPVAVGTSEAAQQLVSRAVDEFGGLDVMVTNAGILRDKVLWNMSDEDFDAVIHVHLRGTFTCAREAMKHFREAGQGGRLVLAGSPAGQRGNFGQTNYAAAKAGIAAMARTWAMECAKAGVTVNAVVPNAATVMTETIPFLAPYVEAMKAGEPIPSVVRRAASFGPPEDVAGLVVFLASDGVQPHHRPVHRHRRRPHLAVVAPHRDPQRVPRRRLECRRDRGGLRLVGRRVARDVRHPAAQDPHDAARRGLKP